MTTHSHHLGHGRPGPAPSQTRAQPRHRLLLAACLLGAATVLVQIAFPLTAGGTDLLTVASVVLFAGASVLHAGATRGAGSALALVLVAGGGGLLAEAVGVHTGLPFGSYAYAGTLGPQVLGVPLVVPLAWMMMAYPVVLAARLLAGRRRWATALVGGWTLTAWDVFLDPQMVAAGHWRWADPTPALPGVEGIPLTNFAGWLVVATLMCALLDHSMGSTAPTTAPRVDALPVAMLLWTYASSVLANAAFFGRPSVALVGGVLMGLTALPLARRVWTGPQARLSGGRS